MLFWRSTYKNTIKKSFVLSWITRDNLPSVCAACTIVVVEVPVVDISKPHKKLQLSVWLDAIKVWKERVFK